MSDHADVIGTDAVAGRILDAAADLFVTRGPHGVGMNEIATAAGCSRATLYRYFESRRALHQSFVNREAMRLALVIRDRTAQIADPEERLVTAICETLDLVRSGPTLAAWFGTGAADLAGELARSSAMVDSVSTAFFAHLGGDSGSNSRKASWTVRCILSLLAIPEADERALVQEFMVPVLLPRAAIAGER